MSFIKLTEDAFCKNFRPIENNGQGHGYYYFEAENPIDKSFLQFIAQHYPNHIWTRVDADDNCIYNINGWHIVDRIDYLVTGIPWVSGNEYEVLDYSPSN
jgi:hypothetical protein